MLSLVILAMLLAIGATNARSHNRKDSGVGLTTVEMIKRQGYKVETHGDIETSDGYLLKLHRIPHGKKKLQEISRPVAFLMHGLICSSAEWVVMGAGKSLAYILADEGYDVWMGNARGNKYSRKHIKYNPDSNPRFWEFSWHEIGTIDLPAMIDYVLDVTDKEQLYLVSHSQGGATFLVMASQKPEYNDKIKLSIALAPAVYMSNMKNPFTQLVAPFQKILDLGLEIFGVHEFVPGAKLLKAIGQVICKDKSIFQPLCVAGFFLTGGWNSNETNATLIPTILSNYPAGGSKKQFIHYLQVLVSRKFRQYDYTWPINLLRYRSLTPPNYDLSKVTCPVVIMYSKNDWLADPKDIERLRDELPNVVESRLVSNHRFNHFDFVYGINAPKYVYKRVITLLKKYK